MLWKILAIGKPFLFVILCIIYTEQSNDQFVFLFDNRIEDSSNTMNNRCDKKIVKEEYTFDNEEQAGRNLGKPVAFVKCIFRRIP